ADLAGSVVNRPEGPAFGEGADQRRTQRRIPRVAGLQPVERARELARQARSVDTEMLEDRRKIAVRLIEQLHQVMFDLDVVMSPRQAQTGSRLQRHSRFVVALSD